MQANSTLGNIRDVMVWRPDRIGDTVITIPAMKLLRVHLPRAHVTYVTTDYARELVELMGMADTVHALDFERRLGNLRACRRLRKQVRSGRYDRIFVLTKTTRYARRIGPLQDTFCVTEDLSKHTVLDCAETVARGLGVDLKDIPGPGLDLPDQPGIAERLCSLGLDAAAGPYMVVHPGSNRMMRRPGGEKGRHPDKRWPLESHRELIGILGERFPDLRIVLVGTENERPHVAEVIERPIGSRTDLVNLVGKTRILDLLQILKHARLLLSGDSGVMHLGTVVGTPLVALFGPTSEGITGPLGMGDRATLIRAVPYELAVAQPDCMQRITVASVFAAVEKRLRGASDAAQP